METRPSKPAMETVGNISACEPLANATVEFLHAFGIPLKEDVFQVLRQIVRFSDSKSRCSMTEFKFFMPY